MVKFGGPCEAPVDDNGTLCGVTQIPDSCTWGTGKGIHAGKRCCTKKLHHIALGIIDVPIDNPATLSAGAPPFIP